MAGAFMSEFKLSVNVANLEHKIVTAKIDLRRYKYGRKTKYDLDLYKKCVTDSKKYTVKNSMMSVQST